MHLNERPGGRGGDWATVQQSLGRVLEMAELSPTRQVYENKIVERFGGQKELDLVMPSKVETPIQPQEAAN